MYRSIFRTEMELRSVQELVKQQMKEQGEVANVSNRGSKPVEILPSFDRTGKFIDTQLRVSDDDGYSSSDELSEISAAAGINA